MKKDQSRKGKFNRREFLQVMGTSTACLLADAAIGNRTYSATSGKGGVIVRHGVFNSREQESYFTTGAWHFADLVAKKSSGEMEVQIFPLSQMGGQVEMARKVQLGILDVCHLSFANLTSQVPELNLLDLPFILRNIETLNRAVVTQEFYDAIYRSIESKGFKTLWTSVVDTRWICLRKGLGKVMRVPTDMKGLKIRTTASMIEQRAIKEAGGNPIVLPFGETLSAMQTRVIDGFNFSLGGLLSGGMQESVESVSNIAFMMDAGLNIANLHWLNNLQKNHKQIILEASNETQTWIGQNNDVARKGVIQKLRDTGIKIIEPSQEELRIWYEAIGHHLPVWNDLKEKWGVKTYENLATAIKKSAT